MNEQTQDAESEEIIDDEEEPRDRASLIIVSDFVCPWCYLGMAEIEQLKQEYDFDVYFSPYYLHPETPPEGMPSRRVQAADAPKSYMEERGEKLGLKYSRGRTWIANSHLAFEAAEFAEDHGDSWAFRRRLFQAYFEELANISDTDTLVRIGAETGLPEGELRAALDEGKYRDQVDERIAWSRDIGVTAVPTFVFNERYGIVGAQELPVFRQMMEKIGQPPRPATAEA